MYQKYKPVQRHSSGVSNQWPKFETILNNLLPLILKRLSILVIILSYKKIKLWAYLQEDVTLSNL